MTQEEAIIDTIEKVAFSIPAPNEWTPQIVQCCVALRSGLQTNPPTPAEPSDIDTAAKIIKVSRFVNDEKMIALHFNTRPTDAELLALYASPSAPAVAQDGVMGVRAIVESIVRDVAELPDRTSPHGLDDYMLVTEQELVTIVRGHLEDALSAESDAIVKRILEVPADELLKSIPKDELDAEARAMKWLTESAIQKARAARAEADANRLAELLRDAVEAVDQSLLYIDGTPPHQHLPDIDWLAVVSRRSRAGLAEHDKER